MYVDVFGEGGDAVVGDYLVYCLVLTVLNIRIFVCVFNYYAAGSLVYVVVAS